MTAPSSSASPVTSAAHEEKRGVSAQSDLIAAFVWMVFGAAVLVGALRMDRLESQNINPYTVPGLLPGLLGIVTMLLGFLLALRSWRRRAAHPHDLTPRTSTVEKQRIALVIALCVGFAVGLVGHGLPFWAGAAIFVGIAILSLQHVQRRAAGTPFGLRTLAKAAAIGLGAGVVITLVFQELFLVHLP